MQIAIENGVNVSCISGPNAALNALVSSGIDPTHFYFHGFLNAKEKLKIDELKTLANKEETLIFYEAPHRIKKTIESMYMIFGDRKACIGREITKKHEEYIRDTLKNLNELDENTLIGEMVIVFSCGFPSTTMTISPISVFSSNSFKFFNVSRIYSSCFFVISLLMQAFLSPKIIYMLSIVFLMR